MEDPFPQEVMPPAKYWTEGKSSWHPGDVSWPGVKGYPVLGYDGRYLKKHEQKSMQLVGYKYVKTFNLSDNNELAYYTWVRDHEGSGLFSVDYESHHPLEVVDGNGNKCIKMCVHLEWRQLYMQMPNHIQGAVRNADAKNFRIQ